MTLLARVGRVDNAGRAGVARGHFATYREYVVVGRVLLLVVLAALTATGARVQSAVAADEPWPTYMPVTSAERRATRPLAEAVIQAYRSGRFSPLCRMISPEIVTRRYGSPQRCERSLNRSVPGCSNRCVFRLGVVIGAYVTERDKALRRKTLAWVYSMKRTAQGGTGDLEIRFRKEAGRWVLLPDIVEGRSG